MKLENSRPKGAGIALAVADSAVTRRAFGEPPPLRSSVLSGCVRLCNPAKRMPCLLSDMRARAERRARWTIFSHDRVKPLALFAVPRRHGPARSALAAEHAGTRESATNSKRQYWHACRAR